MPWITQNSPTSAFYVKDWSVDPVTRKRKPVHLGAFNTRREAQDRIDELKVLKEQSEGGLDYTKGKLPFRFYIEKYRDVAAVEHKGYKASERFVFAALLKDVDKTLDEFKELHLNFKRADDIQEWYAARIKEKADPKALDRQLAMAQIFMKPLDSVTTKDIKEWIKIRQADGIAESTITRQLTLIKSTFKHCKTKEGCTWIGENPAKILDRDSGDIPRTRRINPGERKKLLDTARKHKKPYFALVIEFALETAARQGEIATALIHNYNREHKTLFLHDTKTRSKTVLSRTIGLTNRAVEIIEEALLKCTNEKGLIFGTSSAAIKNSWQDYITEANGFFDLHFHDCRHERTSQMFEEGRLSTEQIMSFTGHKDTRSIQRYMHLDAIHTGKIMRGEKVLVEAA